MNTARVFANASALYVSELLSRAGSVALSIVAARMLGSEDLGRLIFVSSLMVIFSVGADLGLGTYLVRALSRSPDRPASLIAAVTTLRLAASLLIFGAALGYAYTSVPDATARAMLLLAASSLLLNVYPQIISSLLRGQEQMQYESVLRVILAALNAGVGVWLILHGFGVFALTALTVSLALVATLYYAIVSRGTRMPRVRLTLDGAALREALAQAWPFAALSVLVTIYFRIDSVMISYMQGLREAGYYGAAYRIMEIFMTIPGLLSAALLPAMTKAAHSDRDRLVDAGLRSIKLLWMLAFPLALGGACLAAPGIVVIFGRGYLPSVTVFQVLAWTLIPLFASAITSTMITAGPAPAVNTLLAAVMLVMNVGLNLVWIPRYGIVGAGMATLATETAGLILGAVYLGRLFPRFRFAGHAVKPALAAGAMALVLWACHWHWWALPPAGAVYLAALWGFRGLDPRDLALVKSLVLRSPAAEAEQP